MDAVARAPGVEDDGVGGGAGSGPDGAAGGALRRAPRVMANATTRATAARALPARTFEGAKTAPRGCRRRSRFRLGTAPMRSSRAISTIEMAGLRLLTEAGIASGRAGAARARRTVAIARREA